MYTIQINNEQLLLLILVGTLDVIEVLAVLNPVLCRVPLTLRLRFLLIKIRLHREDLACVDGNIDWSCFKLRTGTK